MHTQRGGTILGFILGLVVGLAGALAVAVYVTKVPVPFMQKAQSRTAEQDAQEAQKNKDWDPNAPLHGKNAVKPAPAPAADTPASADDAKPAGDTKAPTVDAKGAAAKGAAPSEGKEHKPAVSADPLGDLAKAKTAASDASEAFIYWVQVGAFRTAEDAEAQRAKLQLAGIEAKVSAREQSGRLVHRVRVGPFDKRDEAERNKEKLDKSGLETALVRVQK